MGDETPVTSLVLPVLIRPILSQVMAKMFVVSLMFVEQDRILNTLHIYFVYLRRVKDDFLVI